MATELYGRTTESKNLTEQLVNSSGQVAGTITGRIDGDKPGTFTINLNVFNETLFQDGKDSALPIVQDFTTNIINQAFAQEYVDTTVTSETAPVAESDDTSETVSTTKSKSKK